MAFGAALLAGGCDLNHASVLDPKGPIMVGGSFWITLDLQNRMSM